MYTLFSHYTDYIIPIDTLELVSLNVMLTM